MDLATFYQDFFSDLRAIFREELEQFHKSRATLVDDTPGPAGQPYINKKEAARLLSCSTGTVDNMARAGRLPRHYVGKKAVRFLRSDVLKLANGGTPEKNR